MVGGGNEQGKAMAGQGRKGRKEEQGQRRAVNPDKVEKAVIVGTLGYKRQKPNTTHEIAKKDLLTYPKRLGSAGPRDVESFSLFLHLSDLLSSVPTSLPGRLCLVVEKMLSTFSKKPKPLPPVAVTSQ